MHSLSLTQLHFYDQISISTLCLGPISGLQQGLHLKRLEEEQSTYQIAMRSHFLKYHTDYKIHVSIDLCCE